MRAASAAQIAFLASRRSAYQADLFVITLADGTVYAWTSWDQPLYVPPYTFSPLYATGRGPLIRRDKWSVKNTIDVPTMDIIISSSGFDMPDGSNLKAAVANGLFDYATVTLSRIFMPTPGDTSLGAIPLFSGNVAQTSINALDINMTVKGANVALAQYMPRNQYMTSCIHSVYDGGCAPAPGETGGGPARADYTVANTVGAGTTRFFVTWGSAPPANFANFALGYITFTSGALEGTIRTIPAGQANSIGVGLAYPLGELPAVGDTFTTTYGCDRTRGAKGCAFFDNLQHNRGFPFVPPAEFGV